MTKGDFVSNNLTYSNMHNFVIRRSIFNALNDSLPLLSGKQLDIGCGKMPYKNYILEQSKVTDYVGLDLEQALLYDTNVSPDFTWDGRTMPFENDSFDCAIGTEVLEHCPEPEIVLKEVYRVLKPNGVFFFTVPFLWNLHEVPHDEYRYTPFSLERHLKNSGLRDINIKATGGWHGAMAQMLGLWVKRSPMPKTKRKWLLYAIKPVMNYLIKLDKPESVTFKEGQMITGLYGTARK